MICKLIGIACLLVLLSQAPYAKAQEQTEAEQTPLGAKRLSIGSTAPSLDIEHWISDANGQRTAVKEFEPGQVYLLEFWGTWCGACIANMPELVDLQKKYLDRGVTIIGVTDEEMEEVKPFLKKKCHHDESLTYGELTSSYCLVADPDGSVFDDYMRGVQRRSFPTVAIIGKTGLIEYIGSANGLGTSLESIVNGTWDREERRKEQDANLAGRKIMYQVHDLCKNGNVEEANDLLDRKVENADQGLRTVSYQIQLASVGRNKEKPDMWSKLEQELIEKTTESMRWHSNRFSFLLENRPALCLKPFQQIRDSYTSSPPNQINLAWKVYLVSTEKDDMEPRLIGAAKQLAKSVSDNAPDNAIYLDVYAHLLFAAGETEASVRTFEKALETSNETNRAEIESDFKEILRAIDKLTIG